ncbi:hypothetical protein KDJ56_05855 [Brevibacillus composti]|uniref:DUF4083 domain-containing protein n=1 Tax=Brevibacillus composti TaxID=2796470 RepID=A0A7T5EMY5_9BACL|nr:hypothetical protein [Brevibacillus composti]QQE75492.1 hypothetical protein JD108_06175 [Brevibacillus composti]QUO42518.1 hypothetical protein KDJ56_05855 [Brevibacillus composti]
MASFAFGSLGILWFLIVLAFYGFILYFLFSVLRFMKEKTENDRARNQKLDLLISQLQKSKRENEE